MRGMRRLLMLALAAVLMLAGACGSAQARPTTFRWSTPQPLISPDYGGLGTSPVSVSCPSERFCAVGSGQFVWTSADPLARKAWKKRRVEPKTVAPPKNLPFPGPLPPMPNDGTIGQLDCTSSIFCLGLGTDDVIASADPLGGEAAWRRDNADDDWSYASCATDTFCLLGGGELTGPLAAGDVEMSVSDDPAALSPVWHQVAVATQELECTDDEGASNACPSQLTGLSCPSTHFCAATDGYGQVLTATRPAHGDAWKAVQVLPPDPDADYDADRELLSCPSQRFCAVWQDEKIYVSTRPGNPAAWMSSALRDKHLDQLDCASARLCVALDDSGNFYFSTDPAAPHPRWTHQRVDISALSVALPATQTDYRVSCPNARVCVMTDPAGRLLVGQLASA